MPAKILKKRTKQHQRYLQANTKVVLVVVPALAQGMMYETQSNIAVDKAKEQQQIDRVWRWSNAVLDSLMIGKHAVDKASSLIKAIDRHVKGYAPSGQPKNIGHYAMVWLAIGYLADEARRFAPERQQRAWNYFASTVNTWTAMMMDNAPSDKDYEAQAGELADKAWGIVFGRPRENFGRL